MDQESLARIKDYFAHELRQMRAENGWNQGQAAEELQMSERTYQKFEDSDDLSCAFSKSVSMLHKFSSTSNYKFQDWLLKTCCPDDQGEFRAKFRWEENVLKKMHSINPIIRREFTKRFEENSIERVELILLLAIHLMSKDGDELDAYLTFFFLRRSKDELPKKVMKEYLQKIIKGIS